MLTDTQIRNAKPGTKARKLYDAKGLFLMVAPGGGKWFRFKYQFAGKEKLMSLGVYPEISLKDARERRDEARKLLATGIDPSKERQEAKAALVAASRSELATFKTVAEEWLEKFGANWTLEHRVTVESRLRKDVIPWIGSEPIAEITTMQLLQLLRRVEARGAVPTARRIKQSIRRIFRFAIATGRATVNPAADLEPTLSSERPKHFGAVTTPVEIARLMRAIDGYTGTFIVRCALKFSAFTFGRPGEIHKAEWNEFDLDERLWRIPAHKMKMRKEHIVPLAPQVVELLSELRQLTGAGAYVFPGRTPSRPMSENAIVAALRYMGYQPGQMTAHGFRAMASTMLNELAWSSDAIERQLAHIDTNEVRSAYNRAEFLQERIQMMTAWADYLDRLTAGGEVIPLRQRV